MTDPFDVEMTDEERHTDELISADLSLLRALVQMRIDSGLTQDDVAKAMGRDPSAVSRFERLDSDPHMSTVRRYARAVNASIQHMVVERGAHPTTHTAGPLFQSPEPVGVSGDSFYETAVWPPQMSDLFDAITKSARAVSYRRHWAIDPLLAGHGVAEHIAELHESTSSFTIPMQWLDSVEAGEKHD